MHTGSCRIGSFFFQGYPQAEEHPGSGNLAAMALLEIASRVLLVAGMGALLPNLKGGSLGLV